MAMLVTHLRRIVLLFAIVYLVSALIKKVYFGFHHTQLNTHKNLHIQLWVYIYTIYFYALLANNSIRENLNVLNVLYSTS